MTKDQIIESIWLKAKKFDPSIRRVVIAAICDSVWREIVMKYILTAPEMAYLFAKEYEEVIFEDESGEDILQEDVIVITQKVISPLHFKGGVFKIRDDANTNFVPVRWIELRSLEDVGVKEIIGAGGIVFSVLSNELHFLGKPAGEIAVSIAYLIAFSEYGSDDEVPLPISSRPDVSYYQIFVDGVLGVLLGERPERKSIDDTNLP